MIFKRKKKTLKCLETLRNPNINIRLIRLKLTQLILTHELFFKISQRHMIASKIVKVHHYISKKHMWWYVY